MQNKKLYIVKVLPGKSPVKVGDKIFDSSSQRAFVVEDIFEESFAINLLGDDGVPLHVPNTSNKVEVVLCSDDVQIGDIFNSANGFGFKCSRIDENHIYSVNELQAEKREIAHVKEHAYKIVGNVSEDALAFANEGRIFTERQIRFQLEFSDSTYDELWWENCTEEEFLDPNALTTYGRVSTGEKRIQILGPCGHFH